MANKALGHRGIVRRSRGCGLCRLSHFSLWLSTDSPRRWRNPGDSWELALTRQLGDRAPHVPAPDLRRPRNKVTILILVEKHEQRRIKQTTPRTEVGRRTWAVEINPRQNAIVRHWQIAPLYDLHKPRQATEDFHPRAPT